MREMLKHAAIEDLHKLMETALAAQTEDGNEADIMFAIVDELRERGEIIPSSEAELEQNYADLVRRAKERKTRDANRTATQILWHEQLLTDAAEDAKVKRRMRLRMTQVAAACVLMIFLINTITVSASGLNFIGDFFRWTGQAVYQLFGGTPAVEINLVHGEMQSIQDELDRLSVKVKLPRLIVEGFTYRNIQSIEEEPYIIIAWFSSVSESKEFLLKVDGSPNDGIGSLAESNSAEPESTFQHGAVVYSVFNNYDRVKIIWEDNGYQLTLQGDLTFDEAKAVILSIESDVIE